MSSKDETKRQGFIFVLTMLLSMVNIVSFAHDIEAANDDGVTIYYTFKNSNTELAVSFRGIYHGSFSEEYTDEVVIPEYVYYNGNVGKDVPYDPVRVSHTTGIHLQKTTNNDNQPTCNLNGQRLNSPKHHRWK